MTSASEFVTSRKNNAARRSVRSRHEPGRTADGHLVELAANIGSIDHIPAAIEAGGAGSGLTVAEEEGIEPREIEVGVMIEVPSGALGAHRLAPHADFLSIGTNDLIQYLFAVDRLNAAVSDISDVLDLDVLALIGDVVEAGHANGAWVGVCGEAAGDPTVAAALVGLGVDELSMTRVAIPEVKDALRRLARDACREAVHLAIAEAGDGTASRRILEERLGTSLAP